MLQRYADLVRDTYQPVQRWEFRCFATVGLALVFAMLMSYSVVGWTNARHEPTATASDLALR